MTGRFSSGKHGLGICDRCGLTFKLKNLKSLTIKARQVTLKVCNECWEPDHPQNELGMFPVEDPQALEEARPDSGKTASEDIAWGWQPVGGARGPGSGLTPNPLVGGGSVGTVTVTIS